ncbi:MAG: rRNA maturation RNase YbeY [Candidatus Nealsonbacteria bacterium]|nr:rRNA maturation RNase YbeY [Candidatus Nealsonbacteria bacterium]
MIEINNLTGDFLDEKFLKKIGQKVLEGESASRQKRKTNLSLVFVSQGKIQKLNKIYRKKNQATDVLAFGQSQKFPIMLENELGLGEVVICPREVKKNAKKYNSSFKKELARVLIHGILHLLPERSEGRRRRNLLRLPERSEGRRRRNLLRLPERSEGRRRRNLLRLDKNHEKNKKEAEKMREKEEYYLSKINKL